MGRVGDIILQYNLIQGNSRHRRTQQATLITPIVHMLDLSNGRPENLSLEDPAPLIWELYIFNIFQDSP